MPPLVLAIEPDHRQAAIVKRIVREKVLAEVAVVDSRDAALEAMRTTVPDVLLLSALLSPRDEDELVAHLRTREDAEHLQTHTIPQLASAIGHDDEKPRGLLSAFRRRKTSGSAPAGCDPDLFAEEIRAYLDRASEKKRELREAAALDTPDRPGPAVAAVAQARSAPIEPDAPADGSSWSSPFEWRPSRPAGSTSAPARDGRAAEPERPRDPLVEATDSPSAIEPAPQAEAAPPREVASPHEIERASHVVAAPVVDVAPRREAADLHVVVTRPRLPLVKRHPREWWFEEHESTATITDNEVREVLASLSVPLQIAAVDYAQGCRIRRVRLATA